MAENLLRTETYAIYSKQDHPKIFGYGWLKYKNRITLFPPNTVLIHSPCWQIGHSMYHQRNESITVRDEEGTGSIYKWIWGNIISCSVNCPVRNPMNG